MSEAPSKVPASPAEAKKQYQAMEQWRQSALASVEQYQPYIQNRVNSQFQEYNPPAYASSIGYRRDINLLVATSRASGMAASLGRPLSDEEIRALTEHTLDSIHGTAVCKWLDFGLAGFMTWRGRHTFQFPFWKPKFDQKFNPNEMSSIFSSKKIQGPYPRYMWHTARFASYGIVITFMIEPVFRALNLFQHEKAMHADSRLRDLVQDADKRVRQVIQQGPPPLPQQSEQGGQSSEDQQQQQQQQYGNDYQKDSDTDEGAKPREFYPERTYRWGQGSNERPSAPSDNDWDALSGDDASPVSASARNQPAGSGGSSWDRLRQQAQPARQQAGGSSQGSWGQASQAQGQSQESSWGSESSGSGGNGYTYNSGDDEQSQAKQQAQREFDEMLERERQAAEQSTSSWGRRS